MIDAHNARLRQRDRDLYDQAALIATGVNNPKNFPKSVKSFRRYKDEVEKENRDMQRQAGIIGARIPGV